MQLGMLDSSRHKIAGVILAMAALVLSTLAVRTPEAHADEATNDDWVETTLASMTLEEKVGQLFMTHAYGTTADTQNPADVAANQKMYGVDNAEQLIDKYQPGGIIYFAWTNSVQNPDQIAELSNGIQDAALAQPLGRRRRWSASTRRAASSPGSARPPPSCPATWRSAPAAAPTTRRPRPRSTATSSRRWASTGTSRPSPT